MFTGIVQNLGIIKSLEMVNQVLRYSVDCPKGFLDGVKLGASIALDGICQTLVDVQDQVAWFEAIQETLNKTTLKDAYIGQRVHLERSAKFGDEIGGHLLSGHIIGTCQIAEMNKQGNSVILTLQCSSSISKYLFPKGFIALDGASLTLVHVDTHEFTVHLIPETLQRTHFGNKGLGANINLEIDAQTLAIVHTAENWLRRHHEEHVL